MDYRKLESLVYAQGFVDSYIDGYIKEATAIEDITEKQKEHLGQFLDMWLRVSVGLDELRKESSDLNSLVFAARNALA